MEVEYDNFDLSTSTTGFLATASYKFFEGVESLQRFNLLINSGLSIYNSKISGNSVEDNSNPIIGLKVGLEGSYFIDENLSIGGRANYRSGDDFSGFEASLFTSLFF